MFELNHFLSIGMSGGAHFNIHFYLLTSPNDLFYLGKWLKFPFMLRLSGDDYPEDSSPINGKLYT